MGSYLVLSRKEYDLLVLKGSQRAQARSVLSGCPQSVQNFALSAFSAWHFGHFMRQTLRCRSRGEDSLWPKC